MGTIPVDQVCRHPLLPLLQVHQVHTTRSLRDALPLQTLPIDIALARQSSRHSTKSPLLPTRLLYRVRSDSLLSMTRQPTGAGGIRHIAPVTRGTMAITVMMIAQVQALVDVPLRRPVPIHEKRRLGTRGLRDVEDRIAQPVMSPLVSVRDIAETLTVLRVVLKMVCGRPGLNLREVHLLKSPRALFRRLARMGEEARRT